MSVADPTGDLDRLVEGLNVASSIAELSTAVEGEQIWGMNRIMASVNKTNKKYNQTFEKVAENVHYLDHKIKANSDAIASSENRILRKVGGVMDSLEDKMITKSDLEEKIQSSKLAKDVHFLEKNVTVDERGQCIYSLIVHGIKQQAEGREKPPETEKLVWSHLLRYMELNQGLVTIIAANRLPKGRNSDKPAPIKVRFQTPGQVHLVLENLHKLKGIEECRRVHVERDIPMMLSDERKKANSIVYQYRKVHGREFIARVTYPRNKLHIAFKRRHEKEYTPLSKDEMESLYKDSRRKNWGDGDDDDDDEEYHDASSSGNRGRPHGQGNRAKDHRDQSKKRLRSTPGETQSRHKSARASAGLFDDSEPDY